MKPAAPVTVSVNNALTDVGLTVLGVAEAQPDDALPEAAPGRLARSIVLAGNAGSAFWPHFTAAPEYGDRQPHPLNRWSARVLSEIAEAHRLGVVFPFQGPPYWPFQQWARRAGNVSQSPLGVLAHRTWGLWFAYRGAFLLSERVAPLEEPRGGPCETCAEKPCLDACPSGALTRQTAYRVDTCRAHVAGAGAETCGTHGCLVRHACPFGRDFAYRPEQATFHMAAFTAVD